MDVTARLDRFQRRHTWVGFPLAVVYKFIDDQGGYLAVLISYYGFVSLFPGLLLLVSVLGYTLHRDPSLQQALLGSVLKDFPIVGPQLQQNVSSIHGSGVGVLLGILGALYGGLGVTVAIQTALNRVWAVPRYARPDAVLSRLRGLALFFLIATVVLITTALAAIGPVAAGYGLGAEVPLAAIVVSTLVNVGAFLFGFRVLSARDIPLSDLLPGALSAGVAIQVLQTVGALFVSRELAGASQIYGVFGLVLGLLAWLYVQAVIVVFCAEINAVRSRRLWPRNLLAPFVDDAPLTRADRASYRSYAGTERFKTFEQVKTTFDGQPPADE
ncbi:MAG: YihY/virulence factor BrkB family protein [Pseudonocardiaceae bacterium]